MGRKQPKKKKKKGGGGGKGPHKLFNLAYWKASQLQPGQKSTLTEAEDAELRKYLYRGHKTVPCDKCGHETHDKDRSGDPWNLPKEMRVCGPCLFGKDGKKFWTSLQQTFSDTSDT